MALSTYTELRAAIASWLNNDDVDVAATIVDAIRLVEADLDMMEEIQDEVRDTLDLDTEVVSLPAECKELKAIYYDDSVRRGPIDLVPEPELSAHKGLTRASGPPTQASVVDNGTALKLSPVPDQTYTVPIKYYAWIDPLATAQGGTNWILERHPNIYLYGALIELTPFLKDDERLALWQARYDRALGFLKRFVNRRRYSANTPTTGARRPLDR